MSVEPRAETAPPPLPLPVATGGRVALEPGCWLVRYEPGAPGSWRPHYDGTLRVERRDETVIASGDLYVHRTRTLFHARAAEEPAPDAGIPIFPRADYRAYLRATALTARTAGFAVELECHPFQAGRWRPSVTLRAELDRAPAPSGAPAPPRYSGTVREAPDGAAGTLSMTWVSPFLRRATIEIDHVATAAPPTAESPALDWASIFAAVGWEVHAVVDDDDVFEPAGHEWSNAEVHDAMLRRRDRRDLDHEWPYHLLCVSRLVASPRGVMYDHTASDSNLVPREGAAIACDSLVPDDPIWGRIRGRRFGDALGPYYRTALHELGHAMGLGHNFGDMGLMNTSDKIAGSASPPREFPDNVEWRYAREDQHRLRHLPDAITRPGGLPYGAGRSAADEGSRDVEEIEGLELVVTPPQPIVPLGALVRVELELSNRTGQPVPVPATISLKSEALTGRVIGPGGVARSFLSLVLCLDDCATAALPEGETRRGSLTLLRGPDGPLFAAPGLHRVEVDLRWGVDGIDVEVRGAADIMVTGPESDAHAHAALAVLSTPNALITLALGGDHAKDGVAAVRAALGDEILRPHFAVVEAKRVGTPFFERPADLKRAVDLLQMSGIVMSRRETKHAADLAARADDSGVAGAAEVRDALRANGPRGVPPRGRD